MAKKKIKRQHPGKLPQHPQSNVENNLQQSKNDNSPNPWSIHHFRLQAIIISVLTFVCYFNSISNEYALDDGIVIVRNEYVQEGFSGIPDILTKDAYESYYRQLNSSNELKGGRYRPLSILTFAVEQQFMGALDQDSTKSMLQQYMASGMTKQQKDKINKEMHVRHFLNILWYILSLLVLLYFLRYIVFRGNPLMAFIATIIFALHPIHTEVVANVKSRDEIMSLLFICLTFIFTFKFLENGKKWLKIAAVVSYFLALLSKEYAITLIILLPLSLYLFNGVSIKKSIIIFLPFLVAIGIYLLMRLHTSGPVNENEGTEVLNNPYLYASYPEEIATKISTSLNYIKLLIFPNPLSADYSYNSIPYKDFANPLVWLSALIYAGLIIFMFRFLPQRPSGTPAVAARVKNTAQNNYRSILCFAMAFYLLNFSLICNLIFNIGGTMGERLIYHSSVGFSIAVAYFIIKGYERIKPAKTAGIILSTFMAVIILLFGYKTISRNADWKNNQTLFAADIKTVPNSVIAIGNVVTSLVDNADLIRDSIQRKESLYKAIELAKKATTIDPVYVAGFFNRGLAWYKLEKMDEAKDCMDSVKAHYVDYPMLPLMYKKIAQFFLIKGSEMYGKNGKWTEAIVEFKKGLAADSANSDLWFNIGVALYANHQVDDAKNAWKNALGINPNYEQARVDLNYVIGLQDSVRKATRK
ncbi:MAG TPA: hypothetical protein VKR53_12010 [Puia sp.]|nr:hypothetical protein [Puia sp.]